MPHRRMQQRALLQRSLQPEFDGRKIQKSRQAQRGDLLMIPLGEHALLRKLYIVYRESEFLPRTSLDFIRFFAEQFPEAASCTALLP